MFVATLFVIVLLKVLWRNELSTPLYCKISLDTYVIVCSNVFKCVISVVCCSMLYYIASSKLIWTLNFTFMYWLWHFAQKHIHIIIFNILFLHSLDTPCIFMFNCLLRFHFSYFLIAFSHSIGGYYFFHISLFLIIFSHSSNIIEFLTFHGEIMFHNIVMFIIILLNY